MFSVVFLVRDWSGVLLSGTDETVDAAFFPLDELPEIPELYRETLEDLNHYKRTGRIILK